MGSLNHWAASPDLGSAGIAELRKQSQDQSVYSPGLPTNGGSGWHLAAHGGTSTKVSSCRSAAVSADLRGAPGRNRTCDTRFRKPLLYPLSYEGDGA